MIEAVWAVVAIVSMLIVVVLFPTVDIVDRVFAWLRRRHDD